PRSSRSARADPARPRETLDGQSFHVSTSLHPSSPVQRVHPPLYSVVLALWGKVAGLSVFSIKALNVLLSFFGGYLWMRVFLGLGVTKPRVVVILAVMFISMWVPNYYEGLLSETLWLPLVALIFLCVQRVAHQADSRAHNSKHGLSREWLALLLVLTLALLCRNLSLALFAPLLLVLLRRPPGHLVQKILVLVLPVATWLAVRVILDQQASHTSNYFPVEALPPVRDWMQISAGLFAPAIFSLNKVVVLLLLILGTATTVHFLKHDIMAKDNRPADLGFTLILSGYVYWISAFALLLMSSVPPLQERFFLVSIPLVIFGATGIFSLASVSGMLRASCLALVLITTLTQGFRNLYFVGDSLTSAPIGLANNFVLNREWVADSLDQINQRKAGGEPLESIVTEFGISANTYRRWQGLPLH
ncbi:MAG: hypothetical protein AAF431_18945, partial [Pseudomonadota bacterium]